MALRQLSGRTAARWQMMYTSSRSLAMVRPSFRPYPSASGMALKRCAYTSQSAADAAGIVQQRSGNAHTGDTSESNTSASSIISTSSSSVSSITSIPPSDWDENPNYNIKDYSELPSGKDFGLNQDMPINDEFKQALQSILTKFPWPTYAFAYGSGVFPQSKPKVTPSTTTSVHSNPPPAVVKAQDGTPKMIDFIFGVSKVQHWHSRNLQTNRDHYSAVGSLGSYAVTTIQERWGAGVYFNPYVTVNGTLIKYGVVNLDVLSTDLSEWNTLYLAGRLHKPVKILRDNPGIRLANQTNLISAVRVALLLLPPSFTEQELYGTIASISYMGDPRMSLPTENPSKVANIVGNNLPHFRRLYRPLIENLPNVSFNDPDGLDDPHSNIQLEQDMDPTKRGNMVRRLPKSFRSKLYFQYQRKYQIPQLEFNKMWEKSSDASATRVFKQVGGEFEKRIASEKPEELRGVVRGVIKKTISWPSTVQSIKSAVTAGVGRTRRYVGEKMQKHKEGVKEEKEKLAQAKLEQAEKKEQ